MTIGLDYHGVIDQNEKLFRQMAIAWRSIGIPVYIISALKIPTAEGAKEQRLKCKVPNDGVELVYFKDYEEIAELKLRVCKRLSVTLMFDDMPAVCKHLAKNGIMTAQIRV
jgi:uncharacterized protein (UPF0254 family)